MTNDSKHQHEASTLTWAEANLLWHTGAPMTQPNGDRLQRGRFFHPAPDESADELIEAPEFSTGSMLWTETYLDAERVAGAHRTFGHDAHVLVDDWDLDTDAGTLSFCVLTSWDLND